ncbi:MAG: hypothetical protein C5B47_00535 [Verrucomicrobia bacterium]|nr:MAG: hypothetical protein C5B47_00535 [Verrucomicrobiota bacterium]
MSPSSSDRYLGIDVIGDVHGEAQKLRRLLERLGYREKSGVYRHPCRLVVFLGDFINRGPEIRKTIHIIRSMQMAGEARVILGNHEYNAIAYARGLAVRANPSKHAKIEAQLAKTLAEYHLRAEDWIELIDWLMGLPICLEMHGIRCVHACWHKEAVRTVVESSLGNHITFSDLTETAGPRSRALKILMNGIKITAPASITLRKAPLSFRIKWWMNGHLTWREAGYPEEPSLPSSPLPEDLHSSFLSYSLSNPLTFFGHYGFPKPASPLLPNLACLDFGVAKGGRLGAYRWSFGEKTLSEKGFVLV